jgi:flagellar motor switch protein FliN/FliY
MPEPENHLAVHALAGEPAKALVRAEEPGEAERGEAEPAGWEPRLHRLPMELHVMMKVDEMRVQDLLALALGTVLTTVHEHAQDVPLLCGGALLMWGEFEVVEQKLAVRVTRLA